MSSFTKALSWGADALDSTFGTSAFSTGYKAASGFIDKVGDIPIIGDIGKSLATTAATKALGLGDQQVPEYQLPQPGTMSPNFNSRVSPGQFRAGQASRTGFDSDRVQNAYRRASQSNNPSIRAALDYVRPTTGKRGPTASLGAAQISRRKT